MHIVIAPNAFKGSLPAEEVANCIAEGIRQSKLDCFLRLIPVSDGGDGTAGLISRKINSKAISVPVPNPLGRLVNASFGWVEDTRTAIIEMSDASGIKLLKKEELNPLIANTKGTGEIILAALDQGAQKIIIGVGGSATVDGASGLLSALGVDFKDDQKKIIENLPEGLSKLKSIDIVGLDKRLKSCAITVMCDVKNTLLGKNGSAAIFGPQKGANEKDVILLEKCLERLSQVAEVTLNVNMNSMTYGGAAGGVAAGLAAFLGAELVSGIEFFLDVVNFDEALGNTDLVITAEGSLDLQTLEGKGPYGVARRAKNKKIPVIGLAGQISVHTPDQMRNYFDVILPIGHAPCSIEEAIVNTRADLIRTSCELGNLLALKKENQ
ncbi:MAG: glycerate kinase [Ginsengibacter sp.]